MSQAVPRSSHTVAGQIARVFSGFTAAFSPRSATFQKNTGSCLTAFYLCNSVSDNRYPIKKFLKGRIWLANSRAWIRPRMNTKGTRTRVSPIRVLSCNSWPELLRASRTKNQPATLPTTNAATNFKLVGRPWKNANRLEIAFPTPRFVYQMAST